MRQRTAPSSRFTRLPEPLTGRTVFRARSRHGIELWAAPLHGFRKTYAVLSARYGSLDTHLPDGTPLPDGTAHFLEHKMFQKGGLDLFSVYDERGATSNAFTTYGSTSYLFWCTSRFALNLDTLLGSVHDLEVDDAGVGREKGIIGQEIAMYDDDPSWRGYMLLLEALYRRHPVRIDIAGTRESIRKIDADLLRRTHAAYYHPKNLVLVVTGHVDPGRLLARLDAEPAPLRAGRRHRRRAFPEPASVASRHRAATMTLSRPHVWLGLKDEPVGGGARLVRRQVLTSIALDVLFADGGRVQAPLYREGLIDDSFHAAYEAESDFGHAVFSAEVEDVASYRRRLTSALMRAAREGVSEEDVERVRRRFLGRRLRVFNGPEPLGHWLLASALEGVALDPAVKAIASATARGVTRRLRDLVERPKSWAILEPSATSTAV